MRAELGPELRLAFFSVCLVAMDPAYQRVLWPTVMLTDSCQTAPSPEISLILLETSATHLGATCTLK